ncbi:MAG TPA: hypothetical protein VJ783_28615 [Pirellulales bacterium]|nr:hypothetical protein [Pirellulales bacterium]
MADLSAGSDERDDTHFWVFCPGCGHAGKIGVPRNHPADVVVCPKCRGVVNVRPEDRILWRPAEANEFLRRQFPHIDWENIDREPRPARPAAEPPAIEIRERAAPRLSAQAEERRSRTVALGFTAVCAAASLATLVIVIGQRAPQSRGRQPDAVAIVERGPDEAAAHEPPAQVDPAAQVPPQPPPKAPPPQPAPPQAPPQAPPVPVPQIPPQPTWQERFDRACQRLQGGDYVAAVDDLNEVLRLNPDFVDALYQRVNANYQLGQYELALADVNEEIRRLPTSYRPFVSRAVLHEKLDEWPQVVADLGCAIDRVANGARNNEDPSNNQFAELLNEINDHAMCLLQEGKYLEAAYVFTVLIRHQANEPLPVLRRAVCYASLQMNDQALIDYDGALAQPSAPAWGYVRRSELRERNGQYDDAVRDMKKAVELAPTNRKYRERLRQLEQFDVRRRFQPQRFPPRPRRAARA